LKTKWAVTAALRFPAGSTLHFTRDSREDAERLRQELYSYYLNVGDVAVVEVEVQ
jgi:hypothetical protein